MKRLIYEARQPKNLFGPLVVTIIWSLFFPMTLAQFWGFVWAGYVIWVLSSVWFVVVPRRPDR